MTKTKFLLELKKGLNGFPKSDIDERLNFYEEIIDDLIEEGMTEDEAVAKLGSVNKIVSQAIAETPITKLIKDRVTPKHSLRAWEIVLLILGSPIWLSLIIAAVSVVFAVYAALVSAVVALWAAELAFALSTLAGTVGCIFFALTNHALTGLLVLGGGIICGGLSVFMFFACAKLTKWIFLLTKSIFIFIKSCFIRKGEHK